MTAADWGILIPAVVALLGAATAWLKAKAASDKVDNHTDNHPTK